MLQNRSITGQESVSQFAHTAATTALAPIVINLKVWIPLNTVGANALNAFLRYAEISGYAQAAVAFNPGDKIYWDNAAQNFTTTSAGNTLCGYAAEPSPSGSGTGIVEFCSFAA